MVPALKQYFVAAALFLSERETPTPGTAVFAGMEGTRPLLCEIQALVAQNPTKMGYEAVKAMVATLHGETVPENVDSGVALITPDNVDTAEIQALLK